MIAEVGTKCVECGRTIAENSDPYWTFDLKQGKLRGLTHRSCAVKASVSWPEMRSAEWGDQAPTEEQIKFGIKLLKKMRELKKRTTKGKIGFQKEEDFCYLLLACCIWKTKNAEECLSHSRVRYHLNEWATWGQDIQKINKMFSQMVKTI